MASNADARAKSRPTRDSFENPLHLRNAADQLFASTRYDEPTEVTADAMDFIAAIRSGLPGRAIKVVAEIFQVPMNEMYPLLHVTPRTAQRMASSEKLDVDKSDHLVQLIKLHKRCVDVFKEGDKANRWLKTPNFALGDQTPFSLLDTTDGIELVTRSLTKIEYGVFG